MDLHLRSVFRSFPARTWRTPALALACLLALAACRPEPPPTERPPEPKAAAATDPHAEDLR